MQESPHDGVRLKFDESAETRKHLSTRTVEQPATKAIRLYSQPQAHYSLKHREKRKSLYYLHPTRVTPWVLDALHKVRSFGIPTQFVLRLKTAVVCNVQFIDPSGFECDVTRFKTILNGFVSSRRSKLASTPPSISGSRYLWPLKRRLLLDR